jgi:organic hydroperoxide reductase OsmC/OhrA
MQSRDDMAVEEALPASEQAKAQRERPRVAPFPHHYTVSLEDGRLLAAPRAAIEVGAPPQFGGSDQVWSPEDLLVGAVLECLWTTFLAYARRDRLHVQSWRGSGTGVLDKARGGPTFTSIALTVEIVVAVGDEDRALGLLAKAEQHCIISNVLRVPVTVAASVRAG